MKSELEDTIIKACPNLYRGVSLPLRECLMAFGMECGDGWYELIFELSKSLEKLILELPEKEREHYYAMQVKEKFGSLRFYVSYGTDEMFTLIDEAETRSESICEVCGKPGIMRKDYGWIYTSCEACLKPTDGLNND